MNRKHMLSGVALMVASAAVSGILPPASAAAGEFDWPLSGPMALAYLVDNLQFHLDQDVLVRGVRPEDDEPKAAATILGKRTTDEDWVLEDGGRAIWVTGASAPEHGRPFVLAGRLRERGGFLSLQGSLLLTVGRPERTALRRGEHVFYDLPGNKSVTCPVELGGDSIEVVHHNPFEYVVLRAVKPGPARLKVFSKWWNSPEVKLLTEYELVVE